jgi:hypothetical protein
MIELQPVRLGTVQAYQSPRFIPQLRVFVALGAGYELGKILDTSAEEKRALVLILGDSCPCWYTFAAVHCVHTYYPHSNTVEIHGEPCNK